MPIIPMKNEVTITPITVDEWNRKTEGAPFTLRCRIQEGTKLVRKTTRGNNVNEVLAQELVSKARIIFHKLVNVKEDDIIEFTDELGRSYRYRAITVQVKRDIGGKPLLTVVDV